MAEHKRQLHLSCECGRNLAKVRDVGEGMGLLLDVREASGVTMEVYMPGQGARIVFTDDPVVREKRTVVGAPVPDDAPPPDVKTYTFRCRCGRTIVAKGERLDAWWHEANDDWEQRHNAAVWRRLLTA